MKNFMSLQCEAADVNEKRFPLRPGSENSATWVMLFFLWASPATGLLYAQTAGTAGSETRDAVVALGRLEPASEVISVGGDIPGATVQSLLVAQGQRVKERDVLAHLDDHEVRLAAKNRAQVRLREAQARREVEMKAGRLSIEAAELQLKRIRELSPLVIDAQEARIASIRSQLPIATYELERLRNRSGNSDELIRARVEQEMQVERLKGEMAVAVKELSRLRSEQTVNLLEAENKLASTRAAMERNLLTPQTDTLAAEVKVADAQLEETLVRAPVDGTILRILSRPGERLDRSPILEIGDTDQMYAVAEVYETDVRLVRTGQRAEITSPALGEKLTGVVEAIGLVIAKNDVLGLDPAARVDARVVEVRIKLDHSEKAARLNNLEVRVRIDVRNDEGA